MPVLDIAPGNNPQAAGTLTFGVEGAAAGFSVDTAGNLTVTSIALTDGLGPETVGYVFEAPAGAVTRVVIRVPHAVDVTAVRGYRVGGTGATINATNDGDDMVSSDVSLSSADSWISASSVENEGVALGGSIALSVRSVAGSPTYVVVQVDYETAAS